ncbi:MAG: HzsA-related protein, partial [Planctomycetota bacterium]
MPDITLAERLVRDAKAGKLGTAGLERAAGSLDHEDPFVRAQAEWAIALKVGRDNNKQTAAWPKEETPAWYRKWTALPLARLVEADWVRQAVSLGIHKDARKLVASADEMLGRAERLVGELGSRGSAGVGRQVALLKNVRAKMTGASSDIASLRGLWIEARRALRPIVFANPAVDFDRLILYTRFAPHHKPNVCGVHTTWTYKPGGDICILSGLESGGRVRKLIRGRLGPGHVHGLDLWFDADRVAFGWANQDRWPPVKPTLWPQPGNQCYAFELRNSTEPPHLYEINANGTGLVQLTDHNFWTDVEPAYCPDGSIAFTSDRSAHSPSCDSYCNDLTDHNLYLLTPDRKHIRRLTNQKDVDMHPHLFDNGLVGYLRWEYQERHFWDVHSVWTVRPDGTMSDALFKQHFGAPTSVRDARSIPGTRKLVAIAAGHHCFPIGPVVILDPGKGLNNEAGVEILTRGPQPQERSKTWKRRKRTWDTNLVAGGGVKDAGGFYLTPFALSEKCFLVSYAYGSRAASKYPNVRHDIDSNGAAVYLVDAHGSKEPVYRHPLYCAVNALPFRKRRVPPSLPDAVDYSKNYAVCVLPDVYEGMAGVERGTVRYIRISEALPWPIVPGTGVLRWDLSGRWCPVRVIGTVPVEEDGSAHFKVPTVDNASVYFQALDAKHMEIRRMRSSISSQPGERRSCNGCHETKAISPGRPQGLAARREPDMPRPPEWGSRKAIGYEWLVQPILNRHCVKCHGGAKPKKGIDFARG